MPSKKKSAVVSDKTAKKHQPSAKALAALAEHQFKPGESGNPGGRPKKFITLLSDALREELGETVGDNTKAELAAKKLVDLAVAGDVKAFAECRDTTEGRPAQTVKVDGNIAITASERAQRIAGLVARAVNAAAQ